MDVVVSGEYLEIDGVLELTSVLDKFDDFLSAISLKTHLSQVLSEQVAALIAEERPQVLDDRLTEEDQSLLAAVLVEDLEEVLLQGGAEWAQLVKELWHQVAVVSDSRRLHEHVERQLRAFNVKDLRGHFKHLAKLGAL